MANKTDSPQFTANIVGWFARQESGVKVTRIANGPNDNPRFMVESPRSPLPMKRLVNKCGRSPYIKVHNTGCSRIKTFELDQQQFEQVSESLGV